MSAILSNQDSIISNQEKPKKPYRILMVTGIYPTPATPHKGTFVKAQVDSLLEAGLEVDVIHPTPGRPTPLRYASALWQIFTKTLPGHYNAVHGHYGLWCLITRFQWTTPVVADYLGDDLLGTVTTTGGYSRKGAFVVKISRWLCKHVDAVLVKSEQMKRAAIGEIVYVIPDGINFKLFQPVPRDEARARLGWNPNRYYVVFANNPNIPVKNFALAEAAIAKLKERGIEAELMVANGLPQTKVVEYINASNALILPSIAEGSPNVVKEAMACNVPVVASNVGDVAEVIGHTEGCSVCPHDAEAFATGLEKAFKHTERTTGRKDIAHLDSAVIADQLISVYERINNKKTKK